MNKDKKRELLLSAASGVQWMPPPCFDPACPDHRMKGFPHTAENKHTALLLELKPEQLSITVCSKIHAHQCQHCSIWCACTAFVCGEQLPKMDMKIFITTDYYYHRRCARKIQTVYIKPYGELAGTWSSKCFFHNPHLPTA